MIAEEGGHEVMPRLIDALLRRAGPERASVDPKLSSGGAARGGTRRQHFLLPTAAPVAILPAAPDEAHRPRRAERTRELEVQPAPPDPRPVARSGVGAPIVLRGAVHRRGGGEARPAPEGISQAQRGVVRVPHHAEILELAGAIPPEASFGAHVVTRATRGNLE